MNKRFFLSLGIAVALFACSNNAQQSNAGADIVEHVNEDGDVADSSGAKIAFTEEKYDFGQIKQGEQVSHVFEFVNTGEKPLIITNVTAGCGCTTPVYDKKPVNPGQKGQIEVGYNSTGQSIGRQQKMISVQSNAGQMVVLQLNGEVTN
ncbi:DUF1573 domain-containing protein [Olivibacter sitiensis]|uniref:DUF1573 domain-containing protein n=1 Tax=Olivibacter sitiensis TaxID=376470 RepID=UPI000411F1BF|nr:DUF1573 domain-containing protein [Olivibacter sitiensis]